LVAGTAFTSGMRSGTRVLLFRARRYDKISCVSTYHAISEPVVRKPKLTEVLAIKELLDTAAVSGQVLPRELPELYENVRDFHVYVDADGIGGCAALHIDMVDLAEVRSLVVRPELRGRGAGRKLVEALVGEATRLAIARVSARTREGTFFARLGFRIVDKQELPYKVFKDCLRCRLFPGCDELAMVRDLPVGEPQPAMSEELAGITR